LYLRKLSRNPLGDLGEVPSSKLLRWSIVVGRRGLLTFPPKQQMSVASPGNRTTVHLNNPVIADIV